jgi:hypothetical protein
MNSELIHTIAAMMTESFQVSLRRTMSLLTRTVITARHIVVKVTHETRLTTGPFLSGVMRGTRATRACRRPILSDKPVIVSPMNFFAEKMLLDTATEKERRC